MPDIRERIRKNISSFFYSRTGIIISSIAHIMVITIAVLCMIMMNKRNEPFKPTLIISLLFLLVMGTTGIVTQINRAKRLKEK